MILTDASATPLQAAVVTGASGFIGRAVVDALTDRRVRLRGFDLTVSAIRPAIRCVDVTSLDETCAAVAEAAGDLGAGLTVFHLAGLAAAGLCRAKPAIAFTANVAATANILEACRRTGISRIVFPSTALVYGVPKQLPVSEDAPVRPRSVYAASKAAAETLLDGYAAEYGLSIDIARLGNVYGPGGPSESVSATLLRQVALHGGVRLRTLAPVRDFVHRTDVAEGLVRLAEAGSEPGARIFNLSSGVATSIGELADVAAHIAGAVNPPVETEPGTGRDDRIVLDVTRLKNRTGWTPAIALRDGLAQVLDELREPRT